MDERGVDYESLLQRCADKAYNFAFRLSGNDPDARDLVQEAFARAFEHRDRYDPTRPFEAWLYRILHNVFLDGVRRYEHKHKVSLDAPPPSNEDGSWAEVLPGKDPEPLTNLMRSEEEAMVQKGLGQLPIHYRTAVTLYDIEGLAYDEIAKIMECPIGTVCSRIHQGRALLKKALLKLGGEKLVSANE
jgi:RNA polymerase sigma-70 factor (ECF subfamily)